MVDITPDNFEIEVLKSEKPVVMDMYADWCGPCRMMSPVFKDLEQEMPDVKFVKVDVEANNELAQKYEVRSIPSFIVVRSGEVVKTAVGANGKASIKQFIENALA